MSARFARDLTWLPNIPSRLDSDRLDEMVGVAGTPGMVWYLGQHIHAKVGIQVQVTREVSRDLEASDFHGSARFDEIPWPAPSVELYFHDTAIPTALVQLYDSDAVEKMFGIRLRNQDPHFVVMAETLPEHVNCCALLRAEHWSTFITTGAIPSMKQGIPLEGEENAALARAASLALKVFAYISIHKCEHIARRQMVCGGKSGVRDRPARPSAVVRYFPTPPISGPRSRRQSAHTFKGRRGHFRHFKSPVFVRKAGTWTYIAPVPGPDGRIPDRPVYKVTQ